MELYVYMYYMQRQLQIYAISKLKGLMPFIAVYDKKMYDKKLVFILGRSP